MADPCIFITGSSTGLGRAAAKLFAAKGWRVVATMRKPEAETELGALPGVTLLALDVTRPDQMWDPLESTCRHASLSIL